MPRTRSLAWAELKFGLIAVFALVMAGLLIFAVGGSGGFFWQNYSLKVKFDNVAGLMEGSPVRVAGVEVGSVTNVELSATGVEVWITALDDMRPLITDRSLATIGSISLLGEGAVDISPGPGGTPIPEWGYVRSGVAPGSIAEITSQASSGINEARLLIEDIRKGRGTVGKLFTDDSVYTEFNALIGAAERLTRNIADGKGSIGQLANNPKMYNELEASVANLNAITAGLRRDLLFHRHDGRIFVAGVEIPVDLAFGVLDDVGHRIKHEGRRLVDRRGQRRRGARVDAFARVNQLGGFFHKQ